MEAARRYNSLTLDRKLQKAVNKFVSEKGREVQNKLLAATQSNQNSAASLPPRVALSIINLPDGEVLAMGGWPRMTSDSYWRRGDDNQERLPPTAWLERHAPRNIQALYGGDRNFDPMVVGSASKPLWASAILAVHPNLDQQLMTRGTEEDEESDVFGIRLTHGWHVRKTNWIDFKTYLSSSDNRYHVRLGFLGLAEREGAAVEGVGASGSSKDRSPGKILNLGISIRSFPISGSPSITPSRRAISNRLRSRVTCAVCIPSASREASLIGGALSGA